MLCMLQIRSTHNYDKVLHMLQNLNVRITSFISCLFEMYGTFYCGSENKLVSDKFRGKNKIGTANIVNHHHV